MRILYFYGRTQSRQLDILTQRLRNQEIAAKLFISPKTEKKLRDDIYLKLNVNRRQQGFEKAETQGLLPR